MRVFDTLLEALRLADEAEAVAVLVDAYVAESGPAVVHGAARVLVRTARQLGRELSVLIERAHDATFMRRERARR